MTSASNSTNMMSLLDENKEDIPEGLYLKMCNLLKDQNKEEEEKKDGFYKIKYLFSNPHQREDNKWLMRIRANDVPVILKLSAKDYESIQEDLSTNGYSSHYKVHSLTSTSHITSYCVTSTRHCDDDDCGGHDHYTDVDLSSQSVIIGIEPA